MSASLRGALVVLGFFVLVSPATAQTIDKTFTCTVTSVSSYADKDAKLTIRCDTNGSVAVTTANAAPMVLTVKVPAPKPVNCVGTWVESTSTAACTQQPDGTWQQAVTTTKTFTATTQPANGGQACPASPQFTVAMQACAPPVTTQLWGATVDPVILGTCPASVHDTFVVDGGDGWTYRTWHPQTVPTPNGGTCTFAHEHGDNPTRMTNAEIASEPIRFGYVGRRMPTATEPNGHDEAHEGFKVFIANPGEVNDEGRMNRVFSRSVFHMGTGGPKRFNTQHHSAMIRLIHPEFSLKAFTNLMMDTGGVDVVCPQRHDAPTKDVVSLNSRCKLDSLYEIWTTVASVMFQGREVYRAFATPAVFDPITVFNPANPTEVVYANDPRLAASLNFPNNLPGYASNRGCDRESYAQPGYWYNAGGRTTYYTDAHGNELASTDPNALVQVISASNSVFNTPTAAPATSDGLAAYKSRPRRWCAPGLGLKN